MKNIDLQNRRAAITGEVQGMGLVRAHGSILPQFSPPPGESSI